MLELTPEDIKKVTGAIGEIENSMRTIEGERDLIKEITKELKDTYKISPVIARKVATFNISQEKKTKAEMEMDIVDYLVELTK